VDINVTDHGFPNVKALQFIEAEFHKDQKHQFGFAIAIVIGNTQSQLDFPLGVSFEMEEKSEDLKQKVIFNPDKFMAFLVNALEIYNKAIAIVNDKTLWIRPFEKMRRFQELHQEIQQSTKRIPGF